MAQIAKKLFRLYLLTYLAVLLLAVSPAAAGQPQALSYAGIYALQQTEPNLTGSGVKFAVISRSITYTNGEPQNDYRPNTVHNCFNAEQFSFHDQAKLPAGTSAHSTAICSILLGEDPNAFNQRLGQFHYHGVAPQAKADVYEFWHFLINNVYPHLPPNADIITAGIGNPFEDWWTRGIESMAEHYGLIVVAGIGNGSDAYDPVLYPAASANVIGVGVVDSVNSGNLATNLSQFALAYPQHSSFGPTVDARCKPDIVAPGNCLCADANDPNRYEPTGSWSSFSTPIVAGVIGLFIQKARQEPNLSSAVSPNGGNCLMKAILLNSAKKLPYWHKGRLEKDDDHLAPLDYIQGAGLLNAPGAYSNLIAGQAKPGYVPTIGWDLNQLQKGRAGRNTYKLALTNPKEQLITATAVWNRHYAYTYPFEHEPDRDSDLRLELWAIDPNNSDNSYLLDYSDSSTDNLEHIYTPADANFTNYEIVVSYSDNDESNQTAATERYALAWNVSQIKDSNNIFWYDLNADGIVNNSDFNILIGNWLVSIKEPGRYLFGDINANGTIDVNDLQILLNHRNQQADWRTR